MRYITLIALITSLLVPLNSAQAGVCDAYQSVVEILKRDHNEKSKALGMSNTGAIIELFTSEDGTWTIVMTMPDGQSCLMAVGSKWTDRPKYTREGSY